MNPFSAYRSTPATPATTTSRSTGKRSRARPVTPRELEVLHWVSLGKSDWQVAEILDISSKTVNFHVERTKKKLCVATRLQAVVAAAKQGLLKRPATA